MKKLLSIVLVLMLMLSAVPLGAFTFSVSAETEGLYTYEVYDGKATITSVDTSISGEITIPSTLGGYPVTSTGSYSIRDCEKLTKVVFPEGFVSIGFETFMNCCNITEIVIPSSVTTISSYAFDYCTSLTSITIPANVSYLAGNAFTRCTNLEKIIIDENNQWYLTDEAGILYDKDMTYLMCCPVKSGITAYQVPNTVKTIGSYAFEWNKTLTEIAIPDSVETIEWYAFTNCSNLNDIILPDSVKEIGAYNFVGTAYYNDESNWQDDILYIGNHLIKVKDTFTGELNIREGTKTFLQYALFCCEQITSINVPDSVDTLPNFAFSGCSGMTEVHIPKHCKSIGQWAFENCSSLKTLTIPSNVSTLDYNAFNGCSSLERLYIPYSVTSIDSRAFNNCENVTIYGYEGSYAQQFAAQEGIPFEIWENENIITEGNIKYEISDGEATVVFVKNTGDSNIIIPDSVDEFTVKGIAANAFNSYQYQYVSVTIPSSIAIINDNAFYGVWIKDTWYEGTEEEKGSIVTGEGNDSLLSANWHFVCKKDEHKYSNNVDLSCKNCDYERPASEIVDSVEIEDVNLICGVDGYVVQEYLYDYETGEYESIDWYRYNYDSKIVVKVTLKDGTVISGIGGVDFNGENYDLEYNDGQNYNNEFNVGTYIITSSVLGVSSTFNVIVKENPVDHIEINTAPTREYVYGDNEYGSVTSNDYYYFKPDDLTGISFTAYYKDGSQKVFTDKDIDEKGMINAYSCSVSGMYNPAIGDVPITLTYMGCSDSYTVTVKESPVESFEMIKSPDKTTRNFEHDFTGAQFKITYIDGNSKIVTVSEENTEYIYNDIFGCLDFKINVDGYYLVLTWDALPATDWLGDELWYLVSYLGKCVQGKYADLEYEEGLDITYVELENVSMTGIGMTVKVTYEDNTTENFVIEDAIYVGDSYYGTTYGFGRTDKGYFSYDIYPRYKSEQIIGYDVYVFGHDITVEVEAKDYISGDINGDTSINNKDLGILMQYLNDWEVEISVDAADVNADGSVNNKDYGLLMQYLNGWEVELR